MVLSLVTAPTAPVVSLAEAKLHLRLDVDDENPLIAECLDAATDYCESFTHRAFLTQTWDYAIDDFPRGLVIDLPKAPLLSVPSVTYIDQAGATQTWSAGNYTVEAPAGPHARQGRIVPGYNVPYPVTRAVVSAVTVRFVAGYGATASTVPAMIKGCIKEHLRAHYGRGAEDREEIMEWIDRTLWPYKAF